jgi:hypothetical protein
MRNMIMNNEFKQFQDLGSFNLLMAFQTSTSETGARDKNSEECERWGRLIEQQLL